MCKLIVKNKTKNYINFNPLTQVVILLTVCHTGSRNVCLENLVLNQLIFP